MNTRARVTALEDTAKRDSKLIDNHTVAIDGDHDRVTALTKDLYDKQDTIVNQQATHTKKLHEHNSQLNTAQADILDIRQNEIDAIWRQVNDQEDEHRATRKQLTDDHNANAQHRQDTQNYPNQFTDINTQLAELRRQLNLVEKHYAEDNVDLWAGINDLDESAQRAFAAVGERLATEASVISDDGRTPKTPVPTSQGVHTSYTDKDIAFTFQSHGTEINKLVRDVTLLRADINETGQDLTQPRLLTLENNSVKALQGLNNHSYLLTAIQEDITTITTDLNQTVDTAEQAQDDATRAQDAFDTIYPQIDAFRERLRRLEDVTKANSEIDADQDRNLEALEYLFKAQDKRITDLEQQQANTRDQTQYNAQDIDTIEKRLDKLLETPNADPIKLQAPQTDIHLYPTEPATGPNIRYCPHCATKLQWLHTDAWLNCYNCATTKNY